MERSAITRARLVLEDGTAFDGALFGHPTSISGEVVFNTGMVGYPETLTDPSYRGQILVFTYPLIGNYGVPAYELDTFGLPIGFESERIQPAGLVVLEYSRQYHHRSAVRSLHDWMASEGIPGLSGIDTRALTKRLRERGTMLGRIEVDDAVVPFHDPNATDLGREVSVTEPATYRADDSRPTVVVVDCGCKTSIVRSLLQRRLNVIRVPYDYYFLNLKFDGIVLSNGPGDPKMYGMTVRNVERALALNKPILGICLGNQILSLAIGADTYKLKFGHRSQNQPCIESVNVNGMPAAGRCVITSQNHGYAVKEQTLPKDWRLWFRNANDGTVEGIRHVSRPFMAVQFHPEATPGPVDTAWVFDEFSTQVTKINRLVVVP